LCVLRTWRPARERLDGERALTPHFSSRSALHHCAPLAGVYEEPVQIWKLVAMIVGILVVCL
jgi:hypothetical protein